jgi:multiple sugar transport system substrate-binding protein
VKPAPLLLAVLLVAGCAEPPAGRGPITLVFKHARILGPADPIPALLAEFESRHPGVRVKSETLPWSADDQHQLYVINLEGRSPGFDVMMLDVIWIPEFARAGWLLDLSGYVAPGELDEFFPSTVAAATWGGRVWALPWNVNVGLLYYRADLLARYGLSPPVTWDELVSAVRRVQAGEGDPRLDGYLWQGKQYEGMVVNVLEALWAAGTELLGEDGTVFPDVERAAEALGFLRGLIAGGVSPNWVTAGDEELTRRTFGDGRAVFLRNWPYAWPLFQARDSPVRGRVGIAPLPGRRPATAGHGSTGGSHLGVSNRTRHPEAAVALARFLTSEPAQRRLLAGTLYPARRRLYHEPALQARHPELPQIHDRVLAARPRPVTPHYLLLSATLQPEFSAVLVGLEPPRRAIADARRRLDYLLAARR